MHVCKAGVTHFHVLKEVLRDENRGGGGGGGKGAKLNPCRVKKCPVRQCRLILYFLCLLTIHELGRGDKGN